MRLLFWCGEFILMLGLWFLLTGKANFSEGVAGAFSIIASLIAVHICVQEPFSRFKNDSRYIFQIWRIPLSVLTGLYQVLYALAQQLFTQKGAQSAMRQIPFQAGDENDPEDKLRRTLALTYPCCSPNFVAIDIDPEKDVYLFHQVKPTPPPKLLTVFKVPVSAKKKGSAP
jgi:hypothetical protein